MSRGASRRIDTNIFEDAKGIRAIARAAGRRREKRFPKSAALKTIKAWQDDTRRELRVISGTRARLSGTLAGDVLHYLDLLPSGRRRSTTAAILSHWVRALGTQRRTSLTAAILQATMDAWQGDGHAGSTVKHRRRVLAQLWTALDGPMAYNAVRHTQRPREPQPEARAIPIDIADAILRAMPESTRRLRGYRVTPIDRSKTKARLRVMLWTGLPQATLMRVRVNDIDLERATLYVRPRRKGQGVPGMTIPLLPEAVEALRSFLRAFAWGQFSTDAMHASFTGAVARYRAAHPDVSLPSDLRPYDLRHTFLTEVYLRTGDLEAVKQLGQHADLKTAERYIQGAVCVRAQMAVETVARARGSFKSHTE